MPMTNSEGLFTNFLALDNGLHCHDLIWRETNDHALSLDVTHRIVFHRFLCDLDVFLRSCILPSPCLAIFQDPEELGLKILQLLGELVSHLYWLFLSLQSGCTRGLCVLFLEIG